jgi:hypothetical protein
MLIKLITHAKTFAFVYATQNHPGNWFLLVSSGEKKVSKFASEDLDTNAHSSGQTH